MVADRGRVEKIKGTPHERRHGWLRNSNKPGDLARVRHCGAKTRRGTPCQCPAIPNGRCRLHGGMSTGPKTPAGIDRIRRAVTKHGQYSKRARAEGQMYRKLLRHWREMLASISGNENESQPTSRSTQKYPIEPK